MAAERTLLAYLRTAVALLAAGATAIELLADNGPAVVTGFGLVVLGALLAPLGVWRFLVTRNRIRRLVRHAPRGRPHPDRRGTETTKSSLGPETSEAP